MSHSINRASSQRLEEMKRVYGKEATESDFVDNSLQTTLFTAGGTVLLMACLKRAGMLFLFEQWRGWGFLILNLVLLAVVLTSMSTGTSTRNSNGDDNHVQHTNLTRTNKKRSDNQYSSRVTEGLEYSSEECRRTSTCGNHYGMQYDNEDDNTEEAEELLELSKEELNERVEAFITMFREQLASDRCKN